MLVKNRRPGRLRSFPDPRSSTRAFGPGLLHATSAPPAKCASTDDGRPGIAGRPSQRGPNVAGSTLEGRFIPYGR